MKIRSVILLSLFLCSLSSGSAMGAVQNARMFVVGSGGPACPNANFTRIQAAVNEATPGAEVHVCPGIYTEPVAIFKPLKLTAEPGAIFMPQYLLANANSLASGSPLAAIVLVSRTEDVEIQGITVDGGAVGFTDCSANLVGVLFQNASGIIHGSRVRNTQLGPSLNGCQNGLGIFVQSGNGGHSDVDIIGNTVSGYQKNGITANEAGTRAEIAENTVVGVGPTSGAAQNGIQVGFGAAGRVSRNFVANNIWSPCISPTQCVYFSTGILIEQSADVQVTENITGNNQINIFANGQRCFVTNNDSYGSVILDGIQVVGDDCQVRWNRIEDSARAGVTVLGNDDRVEYNRIANTQIGILKSTSAVGLRRDCNRFQNVDTQFVDPEPSALGPMGSASAR